MVWDVRIDVGVRLPFTSLGTAVANAAGHLVRDDFHNILLVGVGT